MSVDLRVEEFRDLEVTFVNGSSHARYIFFSATKTTVTFKITMDPSAPQAKSTYTVVQIGCGVVGNAYACAFVNAGHRVFGVEANRERISQLSEFYEMHHVNEDLSILDGVNFVLLSINTPLNTETGSLEMRYLWSSLTNVQQILSRSPNALVVIRSTVNRGFTTLYKRALETALNRDVRVCFQPEFLRAKSALEDAMNPWQVVLGRCDDNQDLQDYFDFQCGFISADRITYCTVDEAEIMKLLHNSFNAAKISFFNQAYLLIEEMNRRDGTSMDAAEVFRIIAKTCEGLMNVHYGLTPGHAYCGTCLPKDSAELAKLEERYGLTSTLFRAVVATNHEILKINSEEVLDGDNHVPFSALSAASSAVTNKAQHDTPAKQSSHVTAAC